jgi:hypothetical protein
VTQKRWLIIGATFALVALVAGLLFWSHAAEKSIHPNQVNLAIGISQKQPVLSDFESVTAHVFTPSKVRTRFFVRIESSTNGKTWKTVESRLTQGPSSSIRSEQKMISTKPIYFRAAAYPLQNTTRLVSVSPVIELHPLDIKTKIREYYKASNLAWASSTSAGLNFWQTHSYPGLFDFSGSGWRKAAAGMLAGGYFEKAKPQTIAIFSEENFVPEDNQCVASTPKAIAQRVFRLRVTVATDYSKSGPKHNPRTSLHRLALVYGQLYGFENPCQ